MNDFDLEDEDFSPWVREDYEERVKKSGDLLFVIHKQRKYAWAYHKVKEYIRRNQLDEVMNPEIYDYLSRETVMKLVDYSAEHGRTGLTAFLLEICGDKRAENEISL